MGLFSSLKHAVKKVAKIALPVAGVAGLGYLGGSALGLFGSSAAGSAAAGAASAASGLSSFEKGALALGAINSASSLFQASRSESIAQNNVQQQMAWNEYAAKHAHQWEMEDLKNAGLNPILSGTGGSGASVHSITPQMPDISGYSSSLNNAFNILSGINSLKQQQEQINKTSAETGLIGAQTQVAQSNNVQTFLKNEILRHDLQKARFEAFIRERFPEVYARSYLYGDGFIPTISKAVGEISDGIRLDEDIWNLPFPSLYVKDYLRNRKHTAKELIKKDDYNQYFYLPD